MGMCPGQAPMTIGPFCLLGVKVVPSEEHSASCGVLADLIQSFIAIGSVNYTFSFKIPLIAFKNGDGDKNKFSFQVFRKSVAHELNVPINR